jgi:hypothetical protein
MQETRTTRLRFTFSGKPYIVQLKSISYTETIIVSKLQVGYSTCWLLFQGGSWRFIGDMPFCSRLKKVLVQKIAAFHGVPYEEGAICLNNHTPLRTGFLLNAFLNVMADKGQLP